MAKIISLFPCCVQIKCSSHKVSNDNLIKICETCINRGKRHPSQIQKDVLFRTVREKDYSITPPSYVFHISWARCQSERMILHAAGTNGWSACVRSCWERSGAVCRLPVRKLSLLAAYVTRHTFGCVSHVGSHPIFHTVCGMRRRQADFLERHSGSSWLHIKLVDLFCCIVQSFCFHGFSKVMMHDIFIVTNIVHLWSAMVNKTEFKLFGE